jgi:anti-anti-sigma regulatory factor
VDIRKHKDARTVPGLVVYRFDDAILFFNADYFKMRLLDAVQVDKPKAVLFDAEAVTSIDVSGIAALREVRDTLAAQGIHFAIARARGTFLRMLVRSGMAREMEDKLLFGSVRAGIGRIGCGATGPAGNPLTNGQAPTSLPEGSDAVACRRDGSLSGIHSPRIAGQKRLRQWRTPCYAFYRNRCLYQARKRAARR